MTTKKKESTSEKKGRVKVKKLQLNKETVKDLTVDEARQIQGGRNHGTCTHLCEVFFDPDEAGTVKVPNG